VSHANWHDWSGYNTPAFTTATADAHHGAYMISALAEGAALVRNGKADAFCFAPVIKM